MSKIKVLLADDYTTDGTGDYMSGLAQDAYEEEQARRQWELSKYTDKELADEQARRILAPLIKANDKLKATLEKLEGAPF